MPVQRGWIPRRVRRLLPICTCWFLPNFRATKRGPTKKNRTDYSNLSKLALLHFLSFSSLLVSLFSCTLTLERVRRSYRHCPKESRLLPFILVAKGARVRFWNFDGPHRVAPAGLQSIRAIGSSSGGHSVLVVCVSRWRACTPPILLHWFSSPVYLCVLTYLSRLCTQRVCWLPTNPPCMRKTHTHARIRKMQEGENEKRKREREKKMRERWCVPTHHWPLPADEIGARSNRERRFDTGQRHQKYRYQTVEGGMWVFFEYPHRKRK